MNIWGYFWFLLGEFVRYKRYSGGVCDFRNQLQISLTGTQTALQRAKASMAKAKAAFAAPAAMVA